MPALGQTRDPMGGRLHNVGFAIIGMVRPADQPMTASHKESPKHRFPGGRSMCRGQCGHSGPRTGKHHVGQRLDYTVRPESEPDLCTGFPVLGGLGQGASCAEWWSMRQVVRTGL